MFDELNKYEQHDHFFLNPQDSLREVCNAPTDKSGLYIIYALNLHVFLAPIYLSYACNLSI